MSRFKALFKFRCPSCEEGHVFQSSGLFSFGKMNKTCPKCKHKFEKEPGFFYGAMYVSYALNVAELVAAFVVCQFFFTNMFDAWMIPILIGTALVLSPLNFKLSRVIWMYLFTKKGGSLAEAS